MESIVELAVMPYCMVIPKEIAQKGTGHMRRWAKKNTLKSVDGRDYEFKILEITQRKSNDGSRWHEVHYLHEGFKPGHFENLRGMNDKPLPQRTVDDLYNKYSKEFPEWKA